MTLCNPLHFFRPRPSNPLREEALRLLEMEAPQAPDTEHLPLEEALEQIQAYTSAIAAHNQRLTELTNKFEKQAWIIRSTRWDVPSEKMVAQLQRRQEQVRALASEIAEENQPSESPITLRTTELLVHQPFTFPHEVDNERLDVITLPPCMLVDFDAFRLFLENHPMDTEEDWNSYLLFVKEQTGIDYPPLSPLHQDNVRALIQLVRDETEEAAMEFILRHELGHIFEGHNRASESLYRRVEELIQTACAVGAIAATFFSFAVAGTLALSAITLKVWEVIRSHRDERAADLYGAAHEHSRAGGIALFQALTHTNAQARTRDVKSRLAYTCEGDFRPHWTSHPSYTQRLQKLLENSLKELKG